MDLFASAGRQIVDHVERDAFQVLERGADGGVDADLLSARLVALLLPARRVLGQNGAVVGRRRRRPRRRCLLQRRFVVAGRRRGIGLR